jgi:hypothetical protein
LLRSEAAGEFACHLKTVEQCVASNPLHREPHPARREVPRHPPRRQRRLRGRGPGAAGHPAAGRGRRGRRTWLGRRIGTGVGDARRRLVAYLPAAGAFVCLLLALLTYGIVERSGQGFAVFG